MVIFNGYVDVVVGDRFVLLEEWEMEFFKFVDIFKGKFKERGIFYV